MMSKRNKSFWALFCTGSSKDELRIRCERPNIPAQIDLFLASSTRRKQTSEASDSPKTQLAPGLAPTWPLLSCLGTKLRTPPDPNLAQLPKLALDAHLRDGAPAGKTSR